MRVRLHARDSWVFASTDAAVDRWVQAPPQGTRTGLLNAAFAFPSDSAPSPLADDCGISISDSSSFASASAALLSSADGAFDNVNALTSTSRGSSAASSATLAMLFCSFSLLRGGADRGQRHPRGEWAGGAGGAVCSRF